MKLWRVWWEDEHGSSLIIAASRQAAGNLFEEDDPDRGQPCGIDEIADLTDLTPREVLGIE